ncbi:hypothetical protein [Streptomyces sp. SID3343]|uniref:hypothetical protein n=1 Tax=Streptomyces sp. SID3343 TaxID=2690260 RepID=UPI0013716528|nr:hypothetical protein [Streptomyces sp. SID3343]MYW02150.1 hypothetical protein [Streptomyces sp. SID3343]
MNGASGWLRRSGALTVAAALAVAVPASAAADGDVLFTIKDERITESSGLVASEQHPDVYWTHNDSSDAPRVYAIAKDGSTKATITLSGVDARDWEAITIGKDDAGKPAIFVGDIGDNLHGKWPEVWIYRFEEPRTLADATVKATKFRVKYDDGPRDAEALLTDPRTNKLYIASKELDGGLYEQPERLTPGGINTFKRIAPVGSTVTDGAFSPDGSRFVLRAYFSATVYSAPGKEVGGVAVPIQRQGESVAWARDGKALLFGSEGKNSQVRRVDLKDDTRPDSIRPATGGSGSTGTDRSTDPSAARGEKSGSDSDSAAHKTKTYGPGLLAVAGLVLLFVAYRKLRTRKS